jgi:hypothetical protein
LKSLENFGVNGKDFFFRKLRKWKEILVTESGKFSLFLDR